MAKKNDVERLEKFTALKNSVPVYDRMDEDLEMADVLADEEE